MLTPALLVLHDELERLRSEVKAENLTELTKDLHFYPDLHGEYGIISPCIMHSDHWASREPLSACRPSNDRIYCRLAARTSLIHSSPASMITHRGMNLLFSGLGSHRPRTQVARRRHSHRETGRAPRRRPGGRAGGAGAGPRR